MEKTEANTGLLADKRFQVSAVTAGLNYYALPNLVIKADYTHRSIGGGKYNDENLVSVGIAYIGWFIKKINIIFNSNENENMEISAYNGNGSMYGDDLL